MLEVVRVMSGLLPNRQSVGSLQESDVEKA